MRTINWSIAAAGRIMHDLVTALSTIENSQHDVIAVADVEITRAKDFAERHEIAKYYDGFDALSQNENIDIVYIGTLNPYHYAVVMLERDKNVLCEKSLCLYRQQAQELYTFSKQKGVFLMKGQSMWSRFFPNYQRLKELLPADYIGRVTHIHVQHGFHAENIERIWTCALSSSITLDIDGYALQLGQFVYGTLPIDVKANAKLNSDGVDVETKLQLSYGENRKLSAFITGMDNLDSNAQLIGTKSEIKLNYYWCFTSLIKDNSSTESWPMPTAKFDFYHTNSCGLRYEAEEIRKCLGNELLACPLYTHAKSLELIGLQEEKRRQLGVVYN